MPRSSDVRYNPAVLANDAMKRRSHSEELPLSCASTNTYDIIYVLGFGFGLFVFVFLK